ncbi:hypothetical protein QAD02_024248 [Eretmocerus hayati]|uniref:Uncharacterized protein n=1 Tax=Eretmocerus hayati TaxID=131215 RepID=A0ACC2PZR2_9HYME|nr:hypothetical protein QAD02_024248 [Eretmocerus hayati]
MSPLQVRKSAQSSGLWAHDRCVWLLPYLNRTKDKKHSGENGSMDDSLCEANEFVFSSDNGQVPDVLLSSSEISQDVNSQESHQLNIFGTSCSIPITDEDELQTWLANEVIARTQAQFAPEFGHNDPVPEQTIHDLVPPGKDETATRTNDIDILGVVGGIHDEFEDGKSSPAKSHPVPLNVHFPKEPLKHNLSDVAINNLTILLR